MLLQQTQAQENSKIQALRATEIAVTASTARFNKLRGIINNALDQGMSVAQISDILKICATYTAMPNILTAYDLLDTVLTERNVRGKNDLYTNVVHNAKDLSKFEQKCISSAQEDMQNSTLNKFSASLAYTYTSLIQETLCHGTKEFTNIVAIAVLSTINADGAMLESHMLNAKLQGFDLDFFNEMATHMEKYAGVQSTVVLRSKL